MNPDVLNMVKIPNEKHTKQLHSLQLKFQLVDPFRILFPNKKEFTYTPRDLSKKNRSRIDFFLVSQEWLPILSDCTIAETLQNKLFDHKAVLVSFKQKKTNAKIEKISPFMTENPLTGPAVALSYYECHLHHAVPVRVGDNQLINSAKSEIGRMWGILRHTAALVYNENCSENFDDIMVMNNLSDIEATLNDFEILDIDKFPFNISHDLFLDYLVNCIRNDTVSLQRFITKTKCARTKKILAELNILKCDYQINLDQISLLEAELNNANEKFMRSELEKYRHFEVLNSEKITPAFLKLARCSNAEYSLHDVKDDNGQAFRSEADRNSYLIDHFAKIYSTPKRDVNRGSGKIEEFLGPDILNNPIVINSKLKLAERESLEGELTLQELDDAVLAANKGSAPGIDGLGMKFIQKYWKFLRVPLRNYALTCFTKGTLTSPFRSACVRLIPKKGDKSKITNWRPISLLSNLYKVLSRALNNRLKTFVSKFTSRAQKGFTDARYIQEVLINVVEAMAYARESGIQGAIISIDMAKAFDTLSHCFLSECYDFFGVGPSFKNMLQTVGNNRTACIILDNGDLSPNFNLDSGRPQGEILSPVQYNICNQILLFKIELDPGIKSLFNNIYGPRVPFPITCNNNPTNSDFKDESRGKPTRPRDSRTTPPP
jgi:hypothetical protein